MSYHSNLSKIVQQMKQNEKNALEAVGLFVTSETKIRAPVDTGRLRSSYRHRVNSGKKNVTIGTDVQYAIFVEKGTRHTRSQPHLTPAIEENQAQIQKIIATQLGRGWT
ncbi:HK97-gp10 family putative phage morphogenesis protein [Thermoactinomyces sp. DSM 45892]|uniref:HK97-gp10 family putative phage morphogenesis protein n=1 Tax=Thermoactinomyces sp. DSM 45892 TaxID=1882753 RepID=UPI00089A2DDE|nr:HK97-gp10 family putative phage morphogenesis protein [Thermoactinomyces sp. DSM 45892]SDY23140.1 phage protein, HK97 gp10 family [Thermoactinomyces sp. DSM 45892]